MLTGHSESLKLVKDSVVAQGGGEGTGCCLEAVCHVHSCTLVRATRLPSVDLVLDSGIGKIGMRHLNGYFLCTH